MMTIERFAEFHHGDSIILIRVDRVEAFGIDIPWQPPASASLPTSTEQWVMTCSGQTYWADETPDQIRRLLGLAS